MCPRSVEDLVSDGQALDLCHGVVCPVVGGMERLPRELPVAAAGRWTHRAREDCLTVLERLRAMARGEAET